MTAAAKADDASTRVFYVYDAWNRLVAVYQDNGDGVLSTSSDTLVTRNRYDGLNRRVTKTAGDGDTHQYFYNNDWQLLADLDGTTNGGADSCDQ